jgi:hypothetical protein
MGMQPLHTAEPKIPSIVTEHTRESGDLQSTCNLWSVEAEFLEVIGTTVLRVFLLAIHSRFN